VGDNLIAGGILLGYHKRVVYLGRVLILLTLYPHSYSMKHIILAAALLGPTIAFAAAGTPLETTFDTANRILSMLVPFLMTLAVVVFFWGLVKYIASANDEAAKEGGKNLMIWGMIALFVMVAFWGIIGYFQETLNFEGTITSTSAPDVILPGVDSMDLDAGY
jgi:uncharacterized membrane protein YidH (DUF202 family)